MTQKDPELTCIGDLQPQHARSAQKIVLDDLLHMGGSPEKAVSIADPDNEEKVELQARRFEEANKSKDLSYVGAAYSDSDEALSRAYARECDLYVPLTLDDPVGDVLIDKGFVSTERTGAPIGNIEQTLYVHRFAGA